MCLKQSDDCTVGGEEREQRARADSTALPALAEEKSGFSLLLQREVGDAPSRPPLGPVPWPSVGSSAAHGSDTHGQPLWLRESPGGPRTLTQAGKNEDVLSELGARRGRSPSQGHS